MIFGIYGELEDRKMSPEFEKLMKDLREEARERGVGWRIDYFVVSDRIMKKVKDSLIYDKVEGSDHCPVGLVMGD